MTKLLMLLFTLLSITLFAVDIDPNGDNDSDGIKNRYEISENHKDVTGFDSDGDGLKNYEDEDDDNDGILTKDENPDPNGDGNPNDAIDSDEDGVADYLDNDNQYRGSTTGTSCSYGNSGALFSFLVLFSIILFFRKRNILE